MKIDGVAGNSFRERWVGYIALHSYDLSMVAPGSTEVSQFTAKTAAGGTTSVQLLNLLANQTVIPRVVLNLVGMDPNGEEYIKFKVTLKDVKFVTSKVSLELKPIGSSYDLAEEHVVSMRFSSATWSKGS